LSAFGANCTRGSMRYSRTGLKVELAALQFMAHLIKAAEPWIDEQIGRELSLEATNDPEGAARKQELRSRPRADHTAETTAKNGLLGASVLVGPSLACRSACSSPTPKSGAQRSGAARHPDPDQCAAILSSIGANIVS
jgi:hypothetical protein